MDQYTIAQGGMLFIDTKTGESKSLSSRMGTLVVAESGIAKQTLEVLSNAKLYAQKAVEAVHDSFPDFSLKQATQTDYLKYNNLVPDKFKKHWYAAIYNYEITKKAKLELEKVNPNIGVLGELMNAHQKILQEQIGNTPKEMIYMMKAAKSAGAVGAKIIGSGGGGCMVAITENANIKLNFAIQKVPENKSKPLGTADALQQCMHQYPELLKERFTVCNGDNLYATDALVDLKKERTAPNALISYNSSGLNFSDERIAKFALMDIDNKGFLRGIIEKPKIEEVDKYRDADGNLRVSMNIFNFSGNVIYPYLENCLLHPIRNEKELPEAVKAMVKNNQQSVYCYPRSENIPDLTDATDIKKFID